MQHWSHQKIDIKLSMNGTSITIQVIGCKSISPQNNLNQERQATFKLNVTFLITKFVGDVKLYNVS